MHIPQRGMHISMPFDAHNSGFLVSCSRVTGVFCCPRDLVTHSLLKRELNVLAYKTPHPEGVLLSSSGFRRLRPSSSSFFINTIWVLDCGPGIPPAAAATALFFGRGFILRAGFLSGMTARAAAATDATDGGGGDAGAVVEAAAGAMFISIGTFSCSSAITITYLLLVINSPLYIYTK